MSTATICELISMAQGIKQEPEMKQRSIRRAGMWEAQRTIELLSISGVTSRQWEGSYSPLHGDRLAVASGIRSSYKVPSSPFPPSISLHHTPFISYLSPVFIIAQIRYLIPLKSVTMAPRVAIVFVCDPRRIY